MKKVLSIALCGLFALACSSIARADDTLRFPAEGFSIKPLHPTLGTDMVQVLTLQLNSDGTFSPNVNVQIQPYTGTLDEYVALSMGQFKQLGFTTITKKKVGEDTVLLDYTGSMQNMELHWYARAVKKKGKNVVYLVTGTALGTQWAKSGPAIRGCVDSFKVD